MPVSQPLAYPLSNLTDELVLPSYDEPMPDALDEDESDASTDSHPTCPAAPAVDDTSRMTGKKKISGPRGAMLPAERMTTVMEYDWRMPRGGHGPKPSTI
jgi:hypothetical protein